MISEDSNTVIESLLQPANDTATCIWDRELNHRTLSDRNGFRKTIPHQSRVASAARLSNLILARLKPMNQVCGKADTCGGLSTDTAFLFGNGAEGVVAVEPEAVFHGWHPARRECLPGGTQ